MTIRTQQATIYHMCKLISLLYNHFPSLLYTQHPPSPDSVSQETLERMRYLAVVDKVEDTRVNVRRQCLMLMQKHIENQLVAVRSRGGHLRRQLARRQQKIRVSEQVATELNFHMQDSTFFQFVNLDKFYLCI